MIPEETDMIDRPHLWRNNYPELIGYHLRDRAAPPPPFPNQCPICRAVRVGMTGDARDNDVALYECSGAYTSKPQIQTHTDYWWGSCPVDLEMHS
jgi:hypothetical protein